MEMEVARGREGEGGYLMAVAAFRVPSFQDNVLTKAKVFLHFATQRCLVKNAARPEVSECNTSPTRRSGCRLFSFLLDSIFMERLCFI